MAADAPTVIKVAVVFGTRPEAIKLAPVISALRERPDAYECLVVSTAQHREMLDQAVSVFDIVPDHDLDIMSRDQDPALVASRVLSELDPILVSEAPDWVLIQGDTTTAMAASLTAFYRQVRVGHVEAGLRSGDRRNPFPEEMNRRLAGAAADAHFAPTVGARDALLHEGVEPWRITVTGNPVIDALLDVAARPGPHLGGRIGELVAGHRRIVLVTAHRRESFGEPLRGILLAVKDIAQRCGDDTSIVFPVHRNPNVMGPAQQILGNVDNVLLEPPMDYPTFVHVLKRSYIVMTDSGGIQEEAPSLGKPVLVTRAVTERPEGIAAGTARLVGVDREGIVSAALRLLDDDDSYRTMANAVNPYGDGSAAQRIVESLLDHHASVSRHL